MGIEITVALVSLGGTLLGACIGSGVSIWATSRQLSLAFQQSKLDVVREQIKGLQKSLEEVTQTSTDVNEPTLDADQIHVRLIDTFLRRAQIFSSFSYMFSDSVEKEVEELVGQASQLIYISKLGGPIDEATSREVIERIRRTHNFIPRLIRERLRVLQSELDAVTLSKKIKTLERRKLPHSYEKKI
jgi:hypothetical protein